MGAMLYCYATEIIMANLTVNPIYFVWPHTCTWQQFETKPLLVYPILPWFNSNYIAILVRLVCGHLLLCTPQTMVLYLPHRISARHPARG